MNSLLTTSLTQGWPTMSEFNWMSGVILMFKCCFFFYFNCSFDQTVCTTGTSVAQNVSACLCHSRTEEKKKKKRAASAAMYCSALSGNIPLCFSVRERLFLSRCPTICLTGQHGGIEEKPHTRDHTWWPQNGFHYLLQANTIICVFVIELFWGTHREPNPN